MFKTIKRKTKEVQTWVSKHKGEIILTTVGIGVIILCASAVKTE